MFFHLEMGYNFELFFSRSKLKTNENGILTESHKVLKNIKTHQNNTDYTRSQNNKFQFFLLS